MSISTKSFLRIEQYDALSKLHIDGRILDIGGSKKSGYHELIKGNHQIITANIDPSYDIDIEFDAQDTWPFDDDSFDGVLFVNVLEHIYDYKKTVSESFRVLKEGGTMAGVVPFMFNLHGSPSDFFRYTRFALDRIFSDAGFKNIKINELGTGATSVIYHSLISFARWDWLAKTLMFFSRMIDRILLLIKSDNKMSSQYMPLGYYFEARK